MLATACPDCNATAGLREIHPGVVVIEVRHDETCPTYKAMESES